MREQGRLDLGRHHVLAAGDDRVDLAAEDDQPPALVEPPEVPGLEAPPAVVGPSTMISPSAAIDTLTPGSGRPDVSMSPGSAIVTAEHACVSP